jgi:hypothetical protein
MKIQSGVCVIVNLTDPKEKFWGVIEDLNEAGVYLRGIDLSSYDELLRLLARGEEGIYPASVFFPLRRVERILLDEANGTIPSMIGRFEEYTGMKLINYLGLE